MNSTQMLMAAHAAFQAGRLEEARSGLKTLLRASPNAAQAQHLLALVERKRGDKAAARTAFARAIAANPSDPEVHNNFGNFLDAEGEPQAAIESYRRAIALKPNFADAHANLGIVALASGDPKLAEQAVRRALELNPKLAKAWLVLGQTLRAQENLPAAAEALDQALALQPKSQKTLATRALVAADRGENSAISRMADAVTANPDDLSLLLAAIALRFSAGDHSGIDTLEALVQTKPDWLEAHRMLTRLKWQAGRKDSCFMSLEAAVRKSPDNPNLWLAYLELLLEAGDLLAIEEVSQRAECYISGDIRLVRARAAAASERGELQLAHALFSRLHKDHPTDRDAMLGFTRLLLRQNEPEHASRLVAPLTRAGDNLAWAYQGTAWRMLEDPRAIWLHGDPVFMAQRPLELDPETLQSLISSVRTLHTTQREPLGQTLRGGTQSSGSLFRRQDQPIQNLAKECREAIKWFVSDLRESSDGHPLLSDLPREPAITGSWSVRLTAGGMHVNHVHPRGWLSSALHLCLPPDADGESRAGWLTLGKPPDELGLGLLPLAEVKPVVGSLVLFPSYIWHGTIPFSSGERLTIAFDVQRQR